MNTHQKIFFSCAVTLGVVAAAFASSPVQKANLAITELPRVSVVEQRVAPEISLERALVVGHRMNALVASNDSTSADSE